MVATIETVSKQTKARTKTMVLTEKMRIVNVLLPHFNTDDIHHPEGAYRRLDISAVRNAPAGNVISAITESRSVAGTPRTEMDDLLMT